MFLQRFKQLITIVAFQVLIVAIILMTARQLFLIQICDPHIITQLLPDYFKSIFIGFRFDMRVATIGFTPILLIGLILSFSKHFSLLKRIAPLYSFLIYFLATAVSIGNYYYFKTYNNHFDIFIFGLIDDDTKAVLEIMWADYPIFIVFVLSSIVALIFTKLTSLMINKCENIKCKRRSKVTTILSVLSTLIIYFILARGSIGTFPLKQYHANVSSYDILNKVTPNGFLALSWANSEHKRDAKFYKVDKPQYQLQMNKILGQNDALYQTQTNEFLKENPPNVVFALMESMGTNILLEDDKDNDLLGSLRVSFKENFVFKRFVSGTGGTINSIVNMLFHSNIGSISHNSVQKIPLSGSAFLPYKKAGYKVIYITGGSPTWRNIKYYMPIQGADEFYDEISIKDFYPEAIKTAGTWGVADEYAFKFAKHLIEENDKPVMIMIQTQTNHPPYEAPTSYYPNELKVSEYVKDKLALNDSGVKKIFETYQYSANALGDFVSSIKSSKYKEQTLIAASGDHRLRSFYTEFPTDLGFTNSVPFFLYVPKTILNKTEYTFDKLRVGSHRDIFPTLYAFSLSNAKYYSLGGRNLLAQTDIENAYGVNDSILITNDGVINKSTPELLYGWAEDVSLKIIEKPIQNKRADLAKEFNKLQTLFINSQIKGFK